MIFPESEHSSLRIRLARGEEIFTTRIHNEMGKYAVGQQVETPFGILTIVSIQHLYDAYRQHPYKDELTNEQRDVLLNTPGELIELKEERT